MADNQEEKIKFILRKNGLAIDESIQKLGISKQTFYNNIRKTPIPNGFLLLFKERLNIDLEESLNNKETKKPDPQDQAEVDSLKAENERLKAELLDLYRRLNKTE